MQSLVEFCRTYDCPTSPQAALSDPCGNYPSVYERGNLRVIGYIGGFGGLAYYFRDSQLVGAHYSTDALDGSCSWIEAGERAVDVMELEDLHDGSCAFEEDDIACWPVCSFCPDYVEAGGAGGAGGAEPSGHTPACAVDMFDD